ncbi:type II toxin-antitoxin system VapC family toxin [Singulisphaera rosea]
MSRSVLDASALLALLFKESGSQIVWEHISGSIISAVNLSEVITKSIDAGIPAKEASQLLAGLPCEIIPFDAEHACLSASLRPATRPFGLSLGDRACLSLGVKTGGPVLTADRTWEECGLSVKLIQLR